MPNPIEELAPDVTVSSITETAVASFAPGKPRSRTIDLEWPVEFEGTVYETITIRRLSAREVADFIESLRDDPNKDEARWPMYDVPGAVLDALDDDDSLTLNEVALAFLPRRFRAAPDAASTQSTGSDTEPKS